MKNLHKITIAILLIFPLSSLSYAVEPQKPTEPQKATTSMPGMGMPHKGMGMMGMTEAEQEKHLQAEQEHMLMMHDLSNKILAEQDSAKKEALKSQQRQLMKAHRAKMMAVHHPMK
ncbi:MAG: hypothetical protein PHR16_13665 [Methylovulum sp.]|nr:hypothetical protein [Methylovulum sp.]